jgi:hypothetical protein
MNAKRLNRRSWKQENSGRKLKIARISVRRKLKRLMSIGKLLQTLPRPRSRLIKRISSRFKKNRKRNRNL